MSQDKYCAIQIKRTTPTYGSDPVLRTSLADSFLHRYGWQVARCGIGLFALVLLVASALDAFAAQPNWAGEYRNENLLNGQAVFQLSIQQSGNAVRLAFDAAYKDAHGAAPDGEGHGRIAGKNALEFKWEDSFRNSGTGMIQHAGDGIIVSMKTTRIVDPRCLVFYGENMRLKPAK